MCVTDIVNFDLPIGWDELGVIATVLAVIVALYSNRKATKQLKSALEIQEQSKNVGLLDKRIELTEKIRSNKSVPEWRRTIYHASALNINCMRKLSFRIIQKLKNAGLRPQVVQMRKNK